RENPLPRSQFGYRRRFPKPCSFVLSREVPLWGRIYHAVSLVARYAAISAGVAVKPLPTTASPPGATPLKAPSRLAHRKAEPPCPPAGNRGPQADGVAGCGLDRWLGDVADRPNWVARKRLVRQRRRFLPP